MLKRYFKHRQDNLLSYRLLVYILLCSTLLAILSTAIQLFWDYRKDLNDIQQGIDSIEAGYLDSLSSSLWKLDQDQIEIQLDGIMKLPDIGFASITEIVADKQESVFYRGDPLAELPIERDFQLFYRDTLVGQLRVGATLDNVYQRLLEKFFIILGSQAIKTFLVSICILLIVHYLIVTHLNTLANFTRELDLDNLDQGIKLTPSRLRGKGSDTIDQLADTLNQMRQNISKQMEGKRKARHALEKLNEELEQRVKYRTATLKHTNDRLSEALKELTLTKDRLVETEKMAALGELVSGIADEIEKPVNNALALTDKIRLQSIESDPIDSIESDPIDSIVENLQQMNELIEAFRWIAINPQSLNLQQVDLRKTFEKTQTLFSEQLLEQEVQLTLIAPEKLPITSYPEIWKQIFSQLLENSLRHGFEGIKSSDRAHQISITMALNSGELTVDYQDNGQGIPETILQRIFDPFVASQSEHGGSGLGTHVLYRLVTGLLQGKISCQSTRGQGVTFSIQTPSRPQQQDADDDRDSW